MIIQSAGQLTRVAVDWWPRVNYNGVRLYDQYNYAYYTLYKTQPNVRTCVDFLARNIAQIGLHVYRRVSDTDRVRLTDHALARLIASPMPAEFKVTRYRLFECLMGDLGVYFNAYWIKVRRADRLALLRVPPHLVSVSGRLFPTKYTIDTGGAPIELAPAEVVHFRGYNAEDAVSGLPPLETLRRILAEEFSAGDYRENLWRNAARMQGVIERPPNAPDWSDPARERFRAEWEELYTGSSNSGKTAILEEGMTWKPGSFDAQQSEYLGGRKLSREECARAYHIPPPMVGILDHATFSNIREQHKNLYQDTLGPWLRMIEEEIELQIGPEFEDMDRVYVEFNIAQKLAGAFEEQIQALQASVGRPFMTANEARARLNLPSMDGDADQLVTPLNVIVSGGAPPGGGDEFSGPGGSPPGVGDEFSAVPSASAAPAPAGSDLPKGGGLALSAGTIKAPPVAGEIDPIRSDMRDRYHERWAVLLVRTFERQRAAVLGQYDKGRKTTEDLAVLWDSARWDREVAEDFYRLSMAMAVDFGQYVTAQLEAEFDDTEIQAYILENARIAAENMNRVTYETLGTALAEEDTRGALGAVFDVALAVRVGRIALGRVTSLASFGAQEGARQGGLRTKTWRVRSANPRPSHAAQDGLTVGIRDVFPNGQRWPGDPNAPAEENANCDCGLTYGR